MSDTACAELLAAIPSLVDITELIHKGFLVLYYEKGKIILADIGTKALPYVDHRRLATNVAEQHSPAIGLTSSESVQPAVKTDPTRLRQVTLHPPSTDSGHAPDVDRVMVGGTALSSIPPDGLRASKFNSFPRVMLRRAYR